MVVIRGQRPPPINIKVKEDKGHHSPSHGSHKRVIRKNHSARCALPDVGPHSNKEAIDNTND